MSETRRDLYKIPEVENFLTNVISVDSEIAPQFDLEFGYRYPLVEKALGKEPGGARDFLEKLAGSGILDRRLHSMDVKCPNCGSSNVSTNYLCPFCNSINVIRDALIEHVSCGYIDLLTNFRKNGDLICPKCHSKLGPGSYRSAGNWYKCNSCEKKIDSPHPANICRKCVTKFTLDDAIFNEVYSYALSDVTKEEISHGVLLVGSIKDNLTKLGYEVVTPFAVKGNSGVEHSFDVLLMKGDKKHALDVLTSDKPIQQIEIIREYVKIIDAKVDFSFIVIPGLSEDARKLAEAYKVSVIESYSPREALSSILKIFEAEKPTSVEPVAIRAEPQKDKPKKTKQDSFSFSFKRRK